MGVAQNLVKVFEEKLAPAFGERNYKRFKEEVTKHVVVLPLAKVFSNFLHRKRVYFDVEYQENVLANVEKTLRDLRIIERFVNNDLSRIIEDEPRCDVILELTCEVDDDRNKWIIRFIPEKFKVKIVVKPYVVNFPPEIDNLFPEGTGMSVLIKDAWSAVDYFKEIIKVTKEFYEEKRKEIKQRLKFLKQPIDSYEYLMKSFRKRTRNGIPRWKMYQKWEEEFFNAFKMVFKKESERIDHGDVLTFRGSFVFHEGNEEEIKTMLEGILKVKELASCLPWLKQDTSLVHQSHAFAFRIYRENWDVFLPSKAYVIKDERNGTFVEVDVTRGADVGRRCSFPKIIDNIEKLLKSELEKARATKLCQEKQKQKKSLML